MTVPMSAPIQPRLWRIRSNLYLGGFSAAGNADVLRHHGVTAVLNVARDHNDRWLDGFQWVKVGLYDSPFNPPHMIELAVDTLRRLLEAGETVLVHCVAGASRSPHVVATYLALTESQSYKQAWWSLEPIYPPMDRRGSPLAGPVVPESALE